MIYMRSSCQLIINEDTQKLHLVDFTVLVSGWGSYKKYELSPVFRLTVSANLSELSEFSYLILLVQSGQTKSNEKQRLFNICFLFFIFSLEALSNLKKCSKPSNMDSSLNSFFQCDDPLRAVS